MGGYNKHYGNYKVLHDKNLKQDYMPKKTLPGRPGRHPAGDGEGTVGQGRVPPEEGYEFVAGAGAEYFARTRARGTVVRIFCLNGSAAAGKN